MSAESQLPRKTVERIEYVQKSVVIRRRRYFRQFIENIFRKFQNIGRIRTVFYKQSVSDRGCHVLIENGYILAVSRKIVDYGKSFLHVPSDYRGGKSYYRVRVGSAENFKDVVVTYIISAIRDAHIRNGQAVAYAALCRSRDKIYRFLRVFPAYIVENAFEIAGNFADGQKFEIKPHTTR